MDDQQHDASEHTAALASMRSQLRWVCEALIPADPEGITPSALEALVPEWQLPRALTIRADIADDFLRLIASLPEEAPDRPLEALHALGTASFDLITYMIAGAYFLSKDVNSKLGYPGQQALRGEPDYDEIFAIAEAVASRGPIYVSP